MILNRMTLVVVLAAMIGGGCSGSRPISGGRWVAQPAMVEKRTPWALVTLSPQQDEFAHYTAFALTVANTGNDALRIDWNASRYEFNGNPQGVLVFEGIDPAAVKTATVPPDIVPPGAVFSRLVMPLRTIAWNPIKEHTSTKRGLAPGKLPAGANGIRLVLRHGADQQAIHLSVRLFQEG